MVLQSRLCFVNPLTPHTHTHTHAYAHTHACMSLFKHGGCLVRQLLWSAETTCKVFSYSSCSSQADWSVEIWSLCIWRQDWELALVTLLCFSESKGLLFITCYIDSQRNLVIEGNTWADVELFSLNYQGMRRKRIFGQDFPLKGALSVCKALDSRSFKWAGEKVAHFASVLPWNGWYGNWRFFFSFLHLTWFHSLSASSTPDFILHNTPGKIQKTPTHSIKKFFFKPGPLPVSEIPDIFFQRSHRCLVFFFPLPRRACGDKSVF